MSKELESLTGLIEVPDRKRHISNYLKKDVFLTSFSGGKKRGHSLQITFEDEEKNYRHVQLDSIQIKKLIKILVETYL